MNTALSTQAILPPLQKQSIVDIFMASTRLYAKHGWPLTRPLVLPMLYQLFGIYGSIAGSYYLLDYFEARILAGDTQAFTLLWVTVLPWTLFTVGVFCMGFWQYIVYFASLNINCAELVQEKTPDFKAAYKAIEAKTWPYVLILKLLILVQIAWFFVFFGSFALALYVKTPPINVIICLTGMGVSMVLALAGVILSVYFSMSFQVLAFEEVPLNPITTAQKSFSYIWKNFWRTVLLLLIMLALTAFIAPTLFTVIARPLYLLYPVDVFHQWFVGMVIEGMQPSLDFSVDVPLGPFSKTIHLGRFFTEQVPSLAAMCSDSLVGLLITALMLPWGTMAYTLLYGDLRCRLETPEPTPNTAV